MRCAKCRSKQRSSLEQNGMMEDQRLRSSPSIVPGERAARRSSVDSDSGKWNIFPRVQRSMGKLLPLRGGLFRLARARAFVYQSATGISLASREREIERLLNAIIEWAFLCRSRHGIGVVQLLDREVMLC